MAPATMVQLSALLCDVPVHDVGVGTRTILQSSRNAAGLDAESFAHLNCNLRLRLGARHLLLGKNGCGKTTLLRAIFSGKLDGWPSDVTTHIVDGDTFLDPALSVLEAVLAADAVVYGLWHEAAELDKAYSHLADETELEAVGFKLSEVYDELGKLNADDEDEWQGRALAILRGLGFKDGTGNCLVGSLSGGWQMRVALAAALFAAPQLLLLDEPTNHLDLEAIEWLQVYLTRQFIGTVLCVSHDRAFIDEVATEIVIFENRNLHNFLGSLADYEKQACQRSKMLERQGAALDSKKEHLMESVQHIEQAVERHERNQEMNRACTRFTKLGGGMCNARESKQSSQVSQRMKKLARTGLEKTADGKRYGAKSQEWAGFAYKDSRIGANDRDGDSWVEGMVTAAPLLQHEDPEFRFSFPEPEPLSIADDVAIVELCRVKFSYAAHDAEDTSEVVLEGVDLSVAPESRIVVTGRNGAGKSTLVGLITGDLQPTGGVVRLHQGLRIAHFNQHHAERLQATDGTPLQYLQRCFPRLRLHELMEQLEAFGVDEQMARQSMSSLSGGQRVRVAFAQLSAEEPHVLVLDEPTNHLDIYSIDALTNALNQFHGAVILVTHNRSLLEEVAREVWTVGNGRVQRKLL